MKINIGALMSRLPKKIIMPVVSLLVVIFIVVVFVNIIRSVVNVKHSNMIDLDIIEPDGTINERKIFKDSIREDKENNARYRRKDVF